MKIINLNSIGQYPLSKYRSSKCPKIATKTDELKIKRLSEKADIGPGTYEVTDKELFN